MYDNIKIIKYKQRVLHFLNLKMPPDKCPLGKEKQKESVRWISATIDEVHTVSVSSDKQPSGT